MTKRRTDTAHEAWEANWRSEAGRADWLDPEPEVVETATRLAGNGAARALDLGAGVGRHALALAALGLRTDAFDASPAGLSQLEDSASRRGLAIATTRGLMTELPYPDDTFDYVLSFNVIYHGDTAVVRRTIGEIARVLAPGGTFQGTMLSKRNARFAVGAALDPHTYVDPDADDDKQHPHFYCTAGELCDLFKRFEPLSLVDREHSTPRSWHWHLVAALAR